MSGAGIASCAQGRPSGCRGTSARAESSRSCAVTFSTIAGHLRSRGEQTVSPGTTCSRSGSPLLARRAAVHRQRERHPDRVTSARAESSAAAVSMLTWVTGHLRSRGEQLAMTSSIRCWDGSPPLARRAGGPGEPAPEDLRVTSARAESSNPSTAQLPRASGHLRSRGEQREGRPSMTTTDGSPPLARRAARRSSGTVPRGRVTSARAESRSGWPPRPARAAGHLRSRGEQATSGRRGR